MCIRDSIECFDNSNLQGAHPVASCVVFRDGKPARKEYRHFNIKTVEGPDDYASMREVVFRRYSRLQEEGAELPDLIIADGGKGQMGIIHEVLEYLGLDIPVAGLAKNDRHRTSEPVSYTHLSPLFRGARCAGGTGDVGDVRQQCGGRRGVALRVGVQLGRGAGRAGEPQRRQEVFSGPFRSVGTPVGGTGCFELRRSDVPLSGDVRHDACKLSVRYACVEQSSRTD